MIGDDKALDPKKYFIVTFALFSNGEVRSFTDLGG
jgi:homoserine O-acetyltransferase